MTGGGVDYSFECAGNGDVLREAFLCTHDVCTLFFKSSFELIGSPQGVDKRKTRKRILTEESSASGQVGLDLSLLCLSYRTIQLTMKDGDKGAMKDGDGNTCIDPDGSKSQECGHDQTRCNTNQWLEQNY